MNQLHFSFHSGIPPKTGTSRNENIHRNLRRFLSKRGSLSTKLALALLHSYFYARNSKLAGKDPLVSCLDAVINMSNATTPPSPTIGFAALDPSLHKNVQAKPCLTDQEETELSRRVRDLISASEKMPKIPSLAQEDQVMGCVYKSRPVCSSDLEEKEHYEKVDAVLKNANLRRVGIIADGDCLYTAVIFMLKNASLSESYKNFLRNLGVDTEDEIENLIVKLREVAVQEVQENHQHYSCFLGEDFNHENLMLAIQEFRNNGCFAGTLGDIMLPAISNALKTNINIITSSFDQPFQHVQPNDAPLNDDPLCLVFIAFGPGHYEATTSISKKRSTKEKKNKCTCGRKTGSPCMTIKCPCFAAKVSCGQAPVCYCRNCANKFGLRDSTNTKPNFCGCGEKLRAEPEKRPCSSTKCPCFLKGRACDACKCKFCGNKHGKSAMQLIAGKKRTPVKKSPIKHSNKLQRESSKDFLTKHDFKMKPLRWSLKESIILSQLIIQKNFQKPYGAVKIKKITDLFNTIISKNPDLGTRKQTSQIRQKLVHTKKVIDDK